MADSYTANLLLRKPATADRNWDVALRADLDALDALAPGGNLAVTPAEVPSTTLNVRVTAGAFAASTGLFVAYAGVSPLALPASATTSLWLTDAGVLVTGAAFPAAFHVPLAVVTTGPAAVTAVVDARKPLLAGGVNKNTLYLALAGGTFNDGSGVVVVHLGTTNGTQFGGSAAEKFGAYGVAPAVQPAGAAQAASPAMTHVALTVNTGGAASTTLAAAANVTAQTNSTTGTASATIPDAGASYSQTTLNNIHASFLARWAEQLALNTVLINSVTSLAAQLNNARADLAATQTLQGALRSALMALGWIKGGA